MFSKRMILIFLIKNHLKLFLIQLETMNILMKKMKLQEIKKLKKKVNSKNIYKK